MKYILLIIGLFSVNSNSQTTSFGDKINGKVKEYKETFFEAKKINNKYVKGKYLFDDTFEIDINNEFVKQSIFSPEKWDIPQNTYNNNRKIETVNYYEDGKIINRTKFIYNSEGVLTEEQFYYASDTLISNTTYEYESSLIIKKITKNYNYDEEKKINIDVVTYKYDLNRNLVSEFLKTENQEELTTYKYNDKNYLIETYSKSSFPIPNKKLKLCKKIEYVKYDNYNWTEIFFEDGLCSDNKSKIFFVERIFKY